MVDQKNRLKIWRQRVRKIFLFNQWQCFLWGTISLFLNFRTLRGAAIMYLHELANQISDADSA